MSFSLHKLSSNLIRCLFTRIQNDKNTILNLKLLGFKNKSGSEISISEKKEGWLIRPDGDEGPIYIVFDNFLRLLERSKLRTSSILRNFLN